MDERDNLRALVDELTDEEVTEALAYVRFLIEQRRPPDGPVEIDMAGGARARDDD
jgi:hypothetical protein